MEKLFWLQLAQSGSSRLRSACSIPAIRNQGSMVRFVATVSPNRTPALTRCRPSVVASHFELSKTVVLHCGHSGQRIQNVTLVGSTAARADGHEYPLAGRQMFDSIKNCPEQVASLIRFRHRASRGGVALVSTGAPRSPVHRQSCRHAVHAHGHANQSKHIGRAGAGAKHPHTAQPDHRQSNGARQHRTQHFAGTL